MYNQITYSVSEFIAVKEKREHRFVKATMYFFCTVYQYCLKAICIFKKFVLSHIICITSAWTKTLWAEVQEFFVLILLMVRNVFCVKFIVLILLLVRNIRCVKLIVLVLLMVGIVQCVQLMVLVLLMVRNVECVKFIVLAHTYGTKCTVNDDSLAYGAKRKVYKS